MLLKALAVVLFVATAGLLAVGGLFLSMLDNSYQDGDYAGMAMVPLGLALLTALLGGLALREARRR
jgi:hypothetical protein